MNLSQRLQLEHERAQAQLISERSKELEVALYDASEFLANFNGGTKYEMIFCLCNVAARLLAGEFDQMTHRASSLVGN